MTLLGQPQPLPAPVPDGQKPAAAPPPEGGAQQTEDKDKPLDFDQLDAKTQSFVKELRAENERYRKAEDKLKADADKATKAAMAEQGKFKELADKAQIELDEVRPFKERYTQLETVLTAALETRKKSVPEQYKKLLHPDLTLVQQWEWLDANAGLFTKPPAPNINPGTPNTPAPGGVGSEAHIQAVKSKFRLG